MKNRKADCEIVYVSYRLHVVSYMTIKVGVLLKKHVKALTPVKKTKKQNFYKVEVLAQYKLKLLHYSLYSLFILRKIVELSSKRFAIIQCITFSIM